ncbi:MAG TPA: N-acyl homoserine lactonase family protein [Bryobacteraceae bacterium]|nr:N-acyl homoserine lactonase family protein [Bryobacteraceae bacterium]
MSTYSIWVMEFARVPEYPLSGLIYGAHNQGHCKLPYCYIVIKGQGQVAMVDVGYNHKAYGEVLANTYGVRDWHPPRAVLAECGLAPEDISNIFITHAHFDHMGNIEDFPNATFYLQERELSKWVWTMSLDRRFRWLMLGIDPADILRAVDLARQGRLVCVDGDRENVLPGIDLHAAFDTHTWGSMYVKVRNDLAPQSGDAWVFAGDLIYKHENLRGDDPADPHYVPVGLATGSQFNLIMAVDRMVRHAGGDCNRVIAGHEERLKDLFPSRITKAGLRITELALADGETSRVH